MTNSNRLEGMGCAIFEGWEVQDGKVCRGKGKAVHSLVGFGGRPNIEMPAKENPACLA